MREMISWNFWFLWKELPHTALFLLRHLQCIIFSATPLRLQPFLSSPTNSPGWPHLYFTRTTHKVMMTPKPVSPVQNSQGQSCISYHLPDIFTDAMPYVQNQTQNPDSTNLVFPNSVDSINVVSLKPETLNAINYPSPPPRPPTPPPTLPGVFDPLLNMTQIHPFLSSSIPPPKFSLAWALVWIIQELVSTFLATL